MENELKTALNDLESGNASAFQERIEMELQRRVGDLIQAKRVEVGNKFFRGGNDD